MAAGDLEAQVEQLYERIQLPKSWLKRLREEAGGRDHRPPTPQHRRARVPDAQARQGRDRTAQAPRRLLRRAPSTSPPSRPSRPASPPTSAAAEERLAAGRRPPGGVARDPGDGHALRHQLRQGIRPGVGADPATIQPSRLQRIEIRDGKIADVDVSPALRPALLHERVRIRRFGGGERTRTADFYVANVALYQLSYTPGGTIRIALGAAMVVSPDQRRPHVACR